MDTTSDDGSTDWGISDSSSDSSGEEDESGMCGNAILEDDVLLVLKNYLDLYINNNNVL